MLTGRRSPFAEVMTRDNSLYGIGFDLTSNVHDCGSDYVPFRQAGYPAIMTHSQNHAPEAHTQGDTIDLVSTSLREEERADRDAACLPTLLIIAAPGGRLPVVLVSGGDGAPRDLNGDGKHEDVNGNGRADFVDVVLFRDQMTWIAANEPVSAFDYNGNGRIDFADVVWLFNHL